jgi:hypothetical protein
MGIFQCGVTYAVNGGKRQLPFCARVDKNGRREVGVVYRPPHSTEPWLIL